MTDPLAPGPAYEPTLFGEPTLPVLPYPDGPQHSSGWSGSETSHERALAEDSGGATSERQQGVLVFLRLKAADGVTWQEVANHFGWHHGQASGALSTLHKEGHIARLAEVRRGRSAVYVLPAYTLGRATAAQGRERRATLTLDHAADVLHQHRPETGVQGLLSCSCGVVDYFHDEDDYVPHLLAMLAQGAS